LITMSAGRLIGIGLALVFCVFCMVLASSMYASLHRYAKGSLETAGEAHTRSRLAEDRAEAAEKLAADALAETAAMAEWCGELWDHLFGATEEAPETVPTIRSTRPTPQPRGRHSA
jgi:hypothetical protein